MEYFLGIDQGGSKTAAIVGDRYGHILGMGKSYGAVHSSDGMPTAMDACYLAAREAVDMAGISFSDICCAAGGLTGIDWKGDAKLLAEALRDTLGISRVCTVNDCIIAMRAGTNASKSAILCAGSGLNCAVRSEKEEYIFGFYIPDELQGGSAIGKAAIKCVFDEETGIGPKTSLTGYVLEYLGIKDVDTLLYKQVNGELKMEDILYLPRLVEKAALEGDTAANDVFRNFAKGVIPYLLSGLRKLGIADARVDVVLSGSIFKCKAPVLLDTVKELISKEAAQATIINAEYEPVIGAYLLALDEHLGERDETVFHAIRNNTEFQITRQ